MALRMAGEEFSVVQGLDRLGWTREVRVNDTTPSLKVTQTGSGPGVQIDHAAVGENWIGFYLGGVRHGKMAIVADNKLMVATEGADLILEPAGSGRLDLRKALYNSSANNNGRVKVDDVLEIEPGTTGPGLVIQHNEQPLTAIRLRYGGWDYGELAFALPGQFSIRSNSGDLQLVPAAGSKIDAQREILNSTGNNGGRVSFADDVELQGGYKLFNVTVEAFTEATKPSAAGNAGRLIYVSDGAASSKFQGSDGTSWVSLG